MLMVIVASYATESTNENNFTGSQETIGCKVID